MIEKKDYSEKEDSIENNDRASQKLEFDISEDIKDIIPPPDVGYAWIIVFCSFVIHCIILGIPLSFGVILKEYLRLEFGNVKDKSQFALVGSLSIALLGILGFISGKLTDKYGYRNMVLFGSTLFALGILLASFASEIWHLYLTQGILCGIGSSIGYIPCISIISNWFDKKRGLATGLAVSGSGIGGLVLSPILEALITNFGLQICLRAVAIASLIICLASGYFFKLRVKSGPKDIKLDFYKNLFKDIRFWGLWLDGLIQNLSILVPLFLIPIYCDYYGLSNSTAVIMIAIINGASAVGRIILGRLADRFGQLNMFVIATLIAALSCFCIWLVAFNIYTITLFCIVFGSVSGVYYSLMPTVSANLLGTENIASILGFVYTSNGIAHLCGSPIAAKLMEFTNGGYSNPFTLMIIFTGMVNLIGVFIMLFIKWHHSGTFICIS